MLPLKDLRVRIVGEKVADADKEILEGLEGLPGGRAWFAGALRSDRVGIFDRQGCGGQAQESCRSNRGIIAYRYLLSSDYS